MYVCMYVYKYKSIEKCKEYKMLEKRQHIVLIEKSGPMENLAEDKTVTFSLACINFDHTLQVQVAFPSKIY